MKGEGLKELTQTLLFSSLQQAGSSRWQVRFSLLLGFCGEQGEGGGGRTLSGALFPIHKVLL